MSSKFWDVVFWVLAAALPILLLMDQLLAGLLCAAALLAVNSASTNAFLKESREQLTRQISDILIGVGDALVQMENLSGLDLQVTEVVGAKARKVDGDDPYIKVEFQDGRRKTVFISDLIEKDVKGHQIYFKFGEVAFLFFGGEEETVFVYMKYGGKDVSGLVDFK